MYVIQAEGGPVKIGVAIDPQKRLAALRTGTPFRLSLVHVEAIEDDLRAVSVERAAHALLSAAHAHGEWFNVTAEEATAAVQRAITDLRRPPATRPCRRMAAQPIRLTPRMSKAARALLEWQQQDLAEASGVPKPTISAFEARGGDAKMATLNNRAAVEAFEAAGLEFIPENGGGAGIRFRERKGP